uniref:PHB_depo_C domain-containing protein n=1 Tax=Steinernema glaseri TaxID=37863 RepID=A0A1I8ART1_9BILA
RSFLAPLAAFTGTSSQWFSNPYSPLAYTPLSRQLAAASELVHRIGKDYEKPAWGLNETQIDGQTVAVREVERLSKPFCRLIHFERDHPKADQDPTILLVAPLSGHHATLLRETVRALLPDHSVYVTDWIDARMVPRSAGPFHLDDYVLYVQEFIQTLGPNVHVMSVCQPTVPVLAAVSLMASRRSAVMPRSMIMMGGPIDTRQSPTEHAGFVAMNPDRHVSSHYDFYQHLIKGDDDDAQAHRRFYDEYNAVLDMPAEFYLDTIRIVFQEHRLPKGQWHVHGEQVRPQDIDGVALFTIEGELDDISGQGQTHSAQGLCSKIAPELKQQFTAPNCGHYGIFSGSRWRTLICPKIRDFIRQHN